jgi:hypothetical protein
MLLITVDDCLDGHKIKKDCKSTPVTVKPLMMLFEKYENSLGCKVMHEKIFASLEK